MALTRSPRSITGAPSFIAILLRPLPLCQFFLLILSLSCTATSRAAESVLSIAQDAYDIPAILSLPEARSEAPAVLLLHGTASHKNEVGNLFELLADQLAAAGIASLRIDFAGSGDSQVSHELFTLTSAVQDGESALRYLRNHPAIDGQRIAVLGFSQGGLIAQRLVLADGAVRSLVTWSTAAVDGPGSFQRLFDRYYDEALKAGSASVEFDFLDAPLPFSLTWFREIESQRTLTEMRAYGGPILALAGLADSTVPYGQSVALVAQSKNSESQVVLLSGADHIFNVLVPEREQPAQYRQLLRISTRWLTRQLPREPHQSSALPE